MHKFSDSDNNLLSVVVNLQGCFHEHRIRMCINRKKKNNDLLC